jgi:UMF1 family MFS transporter
VAALYDHDVYAVSAGGFTLGYIGMGVFTGCLAIVVGIPWLAGASNALWLFSIIPIAGAGLWWGVFSFQVGRMIPDDFGAGEPCPPELKGKGWSSVFWYGLVNGLREQYEGFLVLLGMPDLGYCFFAVMFLSDAANTAYGVAAILATDVLGFSAVVLAGATVVGFISAVVGLKCFTWVVEHRYLVAKQVLLLNFCTLCLLLLYVLWMKTVVDLFIIILIGGFQIGSMGNFTRSLVSLMIPVRRSAKLFALYDLTQKATSWIAPIIIAALTQHYGEGRYRVIVVLTVLVEMVIGIPILAFCCNVERGQQLKMQLDNEDATITEDSEQPATAEQQSGLLVIGKADKAVCVNVVAQEPDDDRRR